MDVVLSSGWLAFASHAGVLAALEAAEAPVDGVCGTSSGALVGALWAAGMPARDVLALLTERRPVAWIRPHRAVWRGAFTLRAMISELSRHLPSTFSGLPRPFAAGVITLQREHRLLTAGPLPQAIAASCAVPYLFAPVRVSGCDYLDGGAGDRLGLAAWRDLRPDRKRLVHLVDRTGGAPTEVGAEAMIVRSPRSGAQLWSMGAAQARFERAREATLAQLQSAAAVP